MITLPDECLFETLINLKDNNRSLFSCLLVNRQWCRNVVPILWREPDLFGSKEFVRTCLLLLNVEEQVSLIPYEIILPKNPKPLFEYTAYSKVIRIHTFIGIRDWLIEEGCKNLYDIFSKVIWKIRYILIKMFLRTSQALKVFYCKDKFVNLLTDILNNFTNLTSLTLWNDMNESNDWDTLAKALYKNTALIDLSIEGCQLNSKVGIAIADALCINTTLTSLDVPDNRFGSEGGKALAKMLHKNFTLTHLDIRSNQLGPEGGKAIAESLYNNSTLIHLYINDNQIGSECGKEFAKVLYKNTTLTCLDISNNQLDFEAEDAFDIHATRVEVIIDDSDDDDDDDDEDEDEYGYDYECYDNYDYDYECYDDYDDYDDYGWL